MLYNPPKKTMKAQVLQEDLVKTLSSAVRFVNTRAQLPILGHLNLMAEKGKLSVLATNLEMSLAVAIGAKVEKEGEVAIPARNFSDIILNLPKGAVSLFLERELLSVSTAGFKSTLSAMNSSDFPTIPRKISGGMKLDSETIRKSLEKVIFAVSTDETRPVLTGVLLIAGKDGLTLVGTDGFRLSQKKLRLSGMPELKLIIPRNSLTEFLKLSSETKDFSFQPRKEDNQAVFGIGEAVLATRVIEGEFPNFERIIPSSSPILVSVDKEELGRAVRLASIFARESGNTIRLQIKKDVVSVLAESQKSGKEEASVEAKVEGLGEEGFEISYNYRFLEEFLNAVESEEVVMKFSDSASPGVFSDPKDSEFLHLIMPIRVQG